LTEINPDNTNYSPYRDLLDQRVETCHKDWISIQMWLYLYPSVISWLVNTPLLQVF